MDHYLSYVTTAIMVKYAMHVSITPWDDMKLYSDIYDKRLFIDDYQFTLVYREEAE